MVLAEHRGEEDALSDDELADLADVPLDGKVHQIEVDGPRHLPGHRRSTPVDGPS